MNELIKTTTNEQGEILVSGRELHEFLEVKTKYGDWMKRMIEYGFVENVDFSVFLKNEQDDTAFGGVRKVTDHALKLDMAKEISMIQRNDKGKEARQYFIEIEKKYKQQFEQDHITLALKAALQTREEVQDIKQDVSYLKETMRIDGVEQQQINELGKQRAMAALGGKDAPAYKECSRKVFNSLWSDFKKHFVIPRYSELPKMKYEEAVHFLNIWQPNASLTIEIQKLNGQGSLF